MSPVRRCVLGGLLALGLSGHAEAQQPTQSQLLVPDGLQLAIMIKTALIAFNHANLTGNYAVLRDLAAPSFREANSPARLAEIFAKPRRDKLNIAPIVLFQPLLDREAWINGRGLLRLKGHFATSPERVNFNLAFEAVQSQWRLYAIGVTTSRAKPEPTGSSPAPTASVPDPPTHTRQDGISSGPAPQAATPAPPRKPATAAAAAPTE